MNTYKIVYVNSKHLIFEKIMNVKSFSEAETFFVKHLDTEIFTLRNIIRIN